MNDKTTIQLFEDNKEEAFGIGVEDKYNRVYLKWNRYNPTNMRDPTNNIMFAPFSDDANTRVPVHCVGISLSVLERIKKTCDTIIVELTTTNEDGSKIKTFLQGAPQDWIDSKLSNTLNSRTTTSKHKEMNNIKNDFQKMYPLASLKKING